MNYLETVFGNSSDNCMKIVNIQSCSLRGDLILVWAKIQEVLGYKKPALIGVISMMQCYTSIDYD